MVEAAAGTTFDRIAPTSDLPLSSESLSKKHNNSNQTKEHQESNTIENVINL